MTKTDPDAELLQEIRDAEQRLSALRKELKARQEKRLGLYVGAIVEDEKGIRHIVRSIQPFFDTASVRGSPAKKNGEWSNSVRHVWDWKLVTPQPDTKA